jgi:hypothetical protein
MHTPTRMMKHSSSSSSSATITTNTTAITTTTIITTAQGLRHDFRELERKEDDVTKLRLALKIKELKTKLKLAKEIEALHHHAHDSDDDDSDSDDDDSDDDSDSDDPPASLNEFICGKGIDPMEQHDGAVTVETSSLPSVMSSSRTRGARSQGSHSSRGAYAR